jgi:D-3-phosphoglycerate dehydrogenase
MGKPPTVVRLNPIKFPPTQAEFDTLRLHGITTIPFEPREEELSAAEVDTLIKQHGDIDGIVTCSCRVVARLGTGCDKIDGGALADAGILLANVPEFCSEEMADHSFALLLSIVRQLPAMQLAVSAGTWKDSRIQCQTIPRLRGTTLGLVGLGGSGRAMAVRAQAFGMPVMA